MYKPLYLRSNYIFGVAGGSFGHTSGVVNALQKLSDLTTITNAPLPGVSNETVTIVPLTNLSIIPKKAMQVNELLYNFKILKYLRNKHYDYIYHRYSGYSFCAAYFSVKKNIPLILEYNGSDLWILKNWVGKKKRLLFTIYLSFFRIPIVRIIENYNLDRATLIVVVSKAMQKELIDRGIDSEKILVNPNGVDTTIYTPGFCSDRMKKMFPDQKHTLGFIGTFGPWHGCKNIVLAYKKLLQEHPHHRENSRLLMIGDGSEMNEVKALIDEYHLEQNITLTGMIPQKEGPEYLSICDILINATVPNPDNTEFFGSPTKLFEYMAMGKAILCSDLAQMKDILEHKKNAYMTQPGNVDDLMQGMKILLEDEVLCKQLGQNAREEVITKYTWDIHVKKIIDKFQCIIKK